MGTEDDEGTKAPSGHDEEITTKQTLNEQKDPSPVSPGKNNCHTLKPQASSSLFRHTPVWLSAHLNQFKFFKYTPGPPETCKWTLLCKG